MISEICMFPLHIKTSTLNYLLLMMHQVAMLTSSLTDHGGHLIKLLFGNNQHYQQHPKNK